GCRRKFSSWGTRSPARTRRWPLMRLRIGSDIEGLQGKGNEEKTATESRATLRTAGSGHDRPEGFVVQPQPGAFPRRVMDGRGTIFRCSGGAGANHVPGVESAHEVAQGGQGVVVLVDGDFGAAVAGGVAVAVQAGFGQQVGAGAFEDAQGAVL